MSDNELRNRIERQLCMFFDEGYDGHLFDASQAIIDDLGLYYETAVGGSYEHQNQRHRFVMGKWERS